MAWMLKQVGKTQYDAIEFIQPMVIDAGAKRGKEWKKVARQEFNMAINGRLTSLKGELIREYTLEYIQAVRTERW